MNRFFVVSKDIIGTSAVITGREAHHIVKVLRMKPGNRLLVCEGEGYEYEGQIDRIEGDRVFVKIIKVRRSTAEPPLTVILAQGLTKKMDKFELVVQKSTELGVSRVVPLLTERTVVRLSKDKSGSRRERWQKIALEAAKQSQRAKVPGVDFPTDLRTFLEAIPRDMLCLMPWEGEQAVSIREVLRWEKENNFRRPAALLIGPEGGFSPEEVDYARRSGAVPVSLGPRILRSETAGIVALGIILYELGDLGGAVSAGQKGSNACTGL